MLQITQFFSGGLQNTFQIDERDQAIRAQRLHRDYEADNLNFTEGLASYQ
jgi:hypothetical protein